LPSEVENIPYLLTIYQQVNSHKNEPLLFEPSIRNEKHMKQQHYTTPAQVGPTPDEIGVCFIFLHKPLL
jgi:hypothetical protein